MNYCKMCLRRNPSDINCGDPAYASAGAQHCPNKQWWADEGPTPHSEPIDIPELAGNWLVQGSLFIIGTFFGAALFAMPHIELNTINDIVTFLSYGVFCTALLVIPRITLLVSLLFSIGYGVSLYFALQENNISGPEAFGNLLGGGIVPLAAVGIAFRARNNMLG